MKSQKNNFHNLIFKELAIPIILSLLLIISGCNTTEKIDQSSLDKTTGQLIKETTKIKGCSYSDGSICNQSCCKTGVTCGDRPYSYKKCNIFTGKWDKVEYKNSDCTGSCIITNVEKIENKKEVKEVAKKKIETKTIDLIEEQKKEIIQSKEIEQEKVLTCSSGWKCKDANYKGYQYSDCSWSTLTYCENRCEDGFCKSTQICIPNTLKCDEKLLRKCNEDGSYWSYHEFCSYGCENGACKPGCTSDYLDNYRCSGDWLERQYRYADCTYDWVLFKSCEFGCSDGVCNEQPIRKYPYDLSLCKGYADCFVGTVTRIIDGDTINVNGITIRLALTDTPESYENGYTEATLFTKELCPVGSEVLVDEDDGQTSGSYGRVIAVIHCSENNLNKELLIAGIGTIDTRFCSKSEFGNEDWAKTYGCEIETITSDLANCFLITNFHYNAEGNDNYNLNDEYVTLKNICSETIDLTSWTIKDEATHIYTFPNFNLDSNAQVTIYSGSGQDTSTELYWGRTSTAVWNNGGDTLFLRDNNGNLVLEKKY